MPRYIIDPNQTVGETLPTVYINRVTLSGDDEDLNVELVVTVKDVMNPGGITQWLNAGSLPNGKSVKDYIKVAVFQTTTKESANEMATTLLTRDTTLIAQTLLRLTNGLSFKEYSLNEFQSNQLREYDSQGDYVLNAAKTLSIDELHNFSRPFKKPSDLSYFVWSFLDTQGLSEDFQINGNSASEIFSGIENVYGRFNSDTIFRNGNLMSEGFVFYEANLTGPNSVLTKTDKLWTGAYHYHRDFPYTIPGTSNTITYTGYMGGGVHDPSKNQPLLMRQTVKNNKIQDFRSVERIDKLQLDFSSIENGLLSSFNGNPRAVDKKGKFSFFTDAWITRDIDNNCRFMFGIDLRKIVRENTPYSILFSTENYENPIWLNEALNRVKINSLKVFRKRIQGSSELSTNPYIFPGDKTFDPVTPPREFNDGILKVKRKVNDDLTTYIDPADELIVESSEVRTSSTQQEFRPLSIDGKSSISQIGGIHGNQDIFYYSVTDGGVSDLTDGFYQYRVEIDLQDNLVDFLIQQRNLLLDSKEALVDYYESATSSRSSIEDGFRKQESYYDPSTNRFTQAFVNSSIVTPNQSVVVYLDSMSLFTKITDLGNVGQNLLSYISKSTGNPKGVLTLIDLHDQLISFINMGIGIEKDKSSSVPKNDKPKNSSGTGSSIFNTDVGTRSKIKSYQVETTFSEYFNANLAKANGYDFMGLTQGLFNNSGLRIITTETWENTIVPRELSKIFNSPDSSITLFGFESKIGGTGQPLPSNSLKESDYSYFTPSLVYDGSKNTPINLINGSNLDDIDFINTSVGTIARSYGQRGIIKTDSLEEKTADFLSYNYNLTAVPSPEPDTDVNGPGEAPTSNVSYTVVDYVNQTNAQSSQNIKAFGVFWSLISDGVVSEGNRGGVSLPEKSSKKDINYYSVGNANGFYNSFSGAYGDDENSGAVVNALNNLPNTVKALIRYNDELIEYTQGRDYGPGALKTDIDNFLKQNPFLYASTSSKARVLFDTIGEIQYLDGFGTTNYTINDKKIIETSSKMPVWKKLDRTSYNSIGGDASTPNRIICRIIPWESDILKTERNPQSDLPTYENYFILETSTTGLAVDNQRPEPFSAAPPDTPENIIGNSTSPNDSSNPLVDAISSNWDAEDIISNVEAASGPPPELVGQQFDIPGGRPFDSSSGQDQSPPTNPIVGGEPNFQTVNQQQENTTQPAGASLGGLPNFTRNTGGRGGSGY
jgi:hypothetical protein